MTPRLSVLDQSPIGQGGTAAMALRETVRLANSLDSWGYHRFWVAEHHRSTAFAGIAPVPLAAVLLENTRRMRIGTGGVLLPRHDPTAVAESFQLLAELHPGRVDLGIGRAGGPAQDFPDRLTRLIGTLGQLRAERDAADAPAVWLLGAGNRSAQLAAALGTNFCFGHFLNPKSSLAVLSGRWPADQPGASGQVPELALAVRVVVAESRADVAELADAYLLWRSRRDLGHDEPLPARKTVREHPWTRAEEQRRAVNEAALVAGVPDEVSARLVELAGAHRVSELIVNVLMHEPADRHRAYRLLAEALRLGEPGHS